MYPILASHSILILFFIHLGVSVIKIRCFSHILLPLRAIGKPKSKSNVYDHRSRQTKCTPSARSKKVLSITMPILPDSSQLSFQHSVSSFLVLSVVVSRYGRPSISSRLVSSRPCLSFQSTSHRHANLHGMSAVYIGGLFHVSCLLLLSLGVAGGTSVFGIQVTWVQVMGFFFFLEV